MLSTRQLFNTGTSTYTYLLWDDNTREAAIIDPVQAEVERDLETIQMLDLKLLYVFETHIHADYITGAGKLREATDARVVVHKNSKAHCANLLVQDGDTLSLGQHDIKILHTPGHTNTDISYLIEGAVFTGEALLIRGCGRTDFRTGNPARLYDSITQKLFTLPANTIVYPGHDYKGLTSSTIGDEKAYNPRLGGNRSKDAFIQVMKSLDMAPPQNLKKVMAGNIRCGLLKPQ